MKALITGASSGIGYSMALYLGSLGYDLIVVARNKDRLDQLKTRLNVNVKSILLDLSTEENCRKLYNQVKDEDIDILINNAGFGTFGNFYETNLTTELEMIDVNIKTVHILTKLFLIDFRKKDKGYILNVASSAAFEPGPLMATYYATKAYNFRLSEAIYEELRREHSNVSISILCPGPVKTNFNEIANVKFAFDGLDSNYVAKYAIDKMFKHKLVIVPGAMMKVMRVITKILPEKLTARIAYNIQKRKSN